MTNEQILSVEETLACVAHHVQTDLRNKIVIVGSVATAWAFRRLTQSTVARTKDIDLVLTPAVDAVVTAAHLAEQFLDAKWTPAYPNDLQPATKATQDEDLPALRLNPPDEHASWFVELLSEPPAEQTERRQWTRFVAHDRHFGLPSFRFLPVAIYSPDITDQGLRCARPACMALAHLLEHATPDRTPIKGMEGKPPRFVKDVGRAVSLWLLSNEMYGDAEAQWRALWIDICEKLLHRTPADMASEVAKALDHLQSEMRLAHEIASKTTLADRPFTLTAFARAVSSLRAVLLDE